jgi:acyl carrier protein
MDSEDRLLPLLIEFFELPADTRPEEIKQQSVPAWDSLAMVQLITDLEQAFSVNFDIEEIGRLRSYQEIRDALLRRAVRVNNSSIKESRR